MFVYDSLSIQRSPELSFYYCVQTVADRNFLGLLIIHDGCGHFRVYISTEQLRDYTVTVNTLYILVSLQFNIINNFSIGIDSLEEVEVQK